MITTIGFAAAIALGAALIVSRDAAAQPALPTPGARVRVTAPDFDISADAGKLVRVTPDSITIDFAEGRPQVTLPMDRLSRLEVSTGKDRGAGLARGATYGALVGALIGVGVAASLYGCDEYCGLGFALFGAGGAGVGLILGGIVGVAAAPDRWEEVSLRRPTNELGMLGASPTMRVGLSISF